MEGGKLGKIPLKQSLVKLHYIPSNVYSVLAENIFVGRIPEKLILAIVPTVALNGQLSYNPFCFDHHDVASVTITTDTELGVSNHQLNIDADQNQYLEAFRNLFSLIPNLELGNAMSREKFLKGLFKKRAKLNIMLITFCILGNCFYAFELTPRSHQSSFQQILKGLVRMEIKFKKTVPSPLTVLLYAQYDAILTFTKDREYSFQ